MFRWISYTHENTLGNTSFELDRHESLASAKAAFARFCDDAGDSSMTLYAYSDGAWESAKEFEAVGCPFDYPDRIIERGPRGGVVINNA